MSDVQFALVIFAVEDVQRARVFYQQVTRWPIVVDTEVYAELVAPTGFRFGLYDRRAYGRNIKQVPEPIAGRVATTELYLVVDDPEYMITRACEAGATLLDAACDRAWGDRVGYVIDPEGYVVAFASSLRA